MTAEPGRESHRPALRDVGGPPVLRALSELRLRRFRNQMRSRRSLALAAITAALAVFVVTRILGLLTRVQDATLVERGVVVMTIGTVATVAWVMATVMLGTDDDLEPRALAALPIKGNRLLGGLLITSFIGIAPFATLVVAYASAATWPTAWPAILIVVPAVICCAVTPVLAARTATQLLTDAVSSRRGQRVGGILIVGGFPLAVLIDRLVGLDLAVTVSSERFAATAEIAGWMPLLSSWAAPWSAARGDWLVSGAQLGLAVASAILLFWLCTRAGARRLHRRPPSPRAGGARRSGLFGFPGLLGALVSRRLSYWLRDRRQRIEAGVAIGVTGSLAAVAFGDGLPSWFPQWGIVLTAYIIGATMLNETATDAAAVRATVGASVSGRLERLGRIVAHLCWSFPVMAVLSLAIGAAVRDQGFPVAVTVAVGMTVLVVTVSVGAATSAMMPLPVPADTENPFSGASGSGVATILQHAAAMPITLAICVPVLVTAGQLPAAALVIGAPVYAAATMALLVLVSARHMDHHGPEVLARLER